MPTQPGVQRRSVLLSLAVLLVVASLAVWLSSSRSTPSAGSSSGGSTVAATTTTSTTATTRGSTAPTPSSGLPRIPEADLPRAARATLLLIRAGGPFPYRQDGQTFGNRERLLPRQPSGYYQEFTVTEGIAGDRGPLRIIGGHDGDLYWTADHYSHFQQIEAAP